MPPRNSIVPNQVIQLTAAANLTEYQKQADYHTVKKNLYDTYGAVTQLLAWNPSTGAQPTRYLIYGSGGNDTRILDELGNQTTFSAVEALSGDRPGTILKAYKKLIIEGRTS